MKGRAVPSVDSSPSTAPRAYPARRLQRRLFVFLLALAVLPLFVGGLIAYLRFSYHIRAEISQNMRGMADRAQTSVQEFLDYLRGRTVDVAADWYISDGLEGTASRAELSRYLRVQRSVVPESTDILLLDRTGRVVGSSNPDDIGHDESGAADFTRGLAGATVTDLSTDPRRPGIQWSVAAPVHSRRTSRLLGVVVNRIDPARLSDVTTGRRSLARGSSPAAMRPGTTGEVYIVNAQGLMITESRFTRRGLPAQRVDTESVRRAARGVTTVADYTDYRGVPITGASALIPEMGWTVIAERDVSEAFAPLVTLRLELLALGFAVVPAVIGLGLLLHRDHIRPMRRLMTADQRVLDGAALDGIIPDETMPRNEWAKVMTVRNDMLRRLDREDVRRIAEIDREQRESRRLADIVRAITSHAPLGTTLQAIADAAHDVCTAERATLELDHAALPGLPRAFTAPDGAGPVTGRGQLAERIRIGDRLAGMLVVEKLVGDVVVDADKTALLRLARHAAIAVESAQFSRELNDAAGRKDQFLATLAHELRNPLSTIGYALHALDRLGAHEDEAMKFRDSIRQQARHLARLVSDLLDVARISAGKLRLEREPVDLALIVGEAVDAMKHRGRTIEVTSPPGAVIVDGDATRLDQVVKNLLDNAFKYSPQDTTVAVTLAADAGEAQLTIQDHGIGIAPEHLARMFEPYMQADAALPRARGGLGLGLALVRGIVDQHGGSITVQSEGLDAGTCVIVRLPTIGRSNVSGHGEEQARL